MEKLNLFFAQIKDISFWQRLFHWRKIRNLSFDAYEEFRALSKDLENGRKTLDDLKNQLTGLSARNDSLYRRSGSWRNRQLAKKRRQKS
jgi:hypothetical protein